MLPHPKDLSAALSDPDQHCPFLSQEKTLVPEEKDIKYESAKFHNGIFRYPTSDNWAPNFPNEMVEVCIRKMIGKCNHETWRISVWGRDDTMRGKDFSCQEEVRRMIRSFPPFLSLKWLSYRGFHDNGHKCAICRPDEKYSLKFFLGF